MEYYGMGRNNCVEGDVESSVACECDKDDGIGQTRMLWPRVVCIEPSLLNGDLIPT